VRASGGALGNDRARGVAGQGALRRRWWAGAGAAALAIALLVARRRRVTKAIRATIQISDRGARWPLLPLCVAGEADPSRVARSRASGEWRGGTKVGGWLSVVLATIVLATGNLTVPASAQTTSWTAGTGSWFVDSNWDNLQPTSGTATTNVVNGGTSQIAGAAANAGNTLNIGGNSTVDLQAAGSLTAGTLNVGANGTLLLSGSTALTGDISMNGGTFRAAISGTLSNNLTFNDNTSSTVLAAPGTTLTFGPHVPASVFTSGNFSTATFGSLTDTGTIVISSDQNAVAPTAKVVVAGGTLRDGNGILGNTLNSITSTTVNASATLDFNDQVPFVSNLLGSGNVIIGTNPASQLFLGSGDQVTGNFASNLFSGVISGPGSVQLGPYGLGGGETILSGTNTYGGGTQIQNLTTLQLGNGGTTGSVLGNVLFINPNTFSTPGSLVFNRSDTYVFDGVISEDGSSGGLGSVTQAGTGTTVLTADSSYSAGTTISAGTLQLGNGGTTGSITGDVTDNGILAVNRSDTYTFAGNITGSGAFQQIGTGTTILTGVNNYTGGTSIDAGVLAVSSDANLGDPSGGLTFNGGTLQFLSGFSTNRDVTLNAGGGTFDTNGGFGELTGAVTGPGGLTKTGDGILFFNGTGSYSGPTSVNAGAMQIFGSDVNSLQFNVTGGAQLFIEASATINQNAAFSLNNGGLVVEGATFQIGSLAGDANGYVTLAVGSTLVVGTNNASTVFAGNFGNDGNGALTKIGTGTLTLTGASSYTGGTTLSVGTLTIGNNAALGTGAVSMASGTTLGFVDGGNFTLGNNISISGDPNFAPPAGTSQTLTGVISDGSSPGTLAMVGPGTLVLTGANTYTGGTVIAQGTLAVGNDAALGTGSVAITTGATLQAVAASLVLGNAVSLPGGNGTIDTQANALTLNGAVSGAGSLTKAGLGSLALNGADTYTGGTLIQAGTLTVGNNGALGLGGLTMADGTTLQSGAANLSLGNAVTLGGAASVDTQANNLTLSGVISGSGSLVKTGSGALVLTGANTYGGGTFVNAGTLQGDTTSLQGDIVDNAKVVFDQAVAGTYAGILSGSGSLFKQNTGLLVLDGNSSGFSGTTTVSAGALEIGDANTPGAMLGGAVTVLGGATLSGHGTLTGSVTNNGGTVAPGGSIGTLTVGGPFTQTAAGTLAIEVSPSGSSQLVVGGKAALAGTLALLYDPGIYTAKNYTLVQAGSISGGFATVTGQVPTAGLSQAVSVNPTTVQLALTGASTPTPTPESPSAPIVVAPTNDTIYTAVTSTLVFNAQNATSMILDRLGSRLGGIADGPLAAATDTAAPVQLAQAGNAEALGALASSMPAVAEGVWFRGLGGFASVNGNSTAPGFTGSTGGFLAGFDRSVAPSTYLGVAAGYLHSNIDEHSTSTGRADTGRVALYGGTQLDANLFAATIGYAHDGISTNRPISGIGAASEGHDGNEVTVGAQWSRPMPIAGLGGGIAALTPRAGLQYLHLSENGFGETGASGFDLSSGGRDSDSLQPYIGVAVAQKFVTDNGAVATPELRLGYAREVLSNSRLLSVATVSGFSFPVVGVAPSRDQVSAGIGVTMTAGSGVLLYGNYDTVLRTGNTTEQALSAGLRVRF
jgi:fibronectin-binding autotransporter adhesin